MIRPRQRVAHGRLLLLCAVTLFAGCAQLPPPKSVATVKAAELPSNVDQLLAYADGQYKNQSAATVDNSLVAIDKALTLRPRDYQALWRGARGCAWLTQEFTDKQQRGAFAKRGITYGKGAVAANPRGVEGHYYLGINQGQLATTKTFGAFDLVPHLVKSAKEAVALNEKYDHAGPLRLLGTVYAKAPPWPASVGDVDEGIKYLSRAVELSPEFPQNHLLYGEALAGDDRVADAEREYQEVVNAPSDPEWAHWLPIWRSEAEENLRKLAKKKGQPLSEQ